MIIKIVKNGPLIFEMEEPSELEIDDGKKFVDLKKYILCRCGHSRDQPFCDDSCVKENFEAPGGEIELTWGPVEKREINIKKDGPIKIPLKGSYIYRKDGSVEEKTENKLALCRCGKSKIKPFCDGSHRFVDFESIGGKIKIKIN